MLFVSDQFNKITLTSLDQKEAGKRGILLEEMDYAEGIRLMNEAWDEGEIRFCIENPRTRKSIIGLFPHTSGVSLEFPTIKKGDHLMIIVDSPLLDISRIILLHFKNNDLPLPVES